MPIPMQPALAVQASDRCHAWMGVNLSIEPVQLRLVHDAPMQAGTLLLCCCWLFHDGYNTSRSVQ